LSIDPVNGCLHVEGHIGDRRRVTRPVVRQARHHHVGIADGFDLF
jgi:hypothetical protein